LSATSTGVLKELEGGRGCEVKSTIPFRISALESVSGEILLNINSDQESRLYLFRGK